MPDIGRIHVTAPSELEIIFHTNYENNLAHLKEHHPAAARIVEEEENDIGRFTITKQNENLYVSYAYSLKSFTAQIARTEDFSFSADEMKFIGSKRMVFSDILWGALLAQLVRIPVPDHVIRNAYVRRIPFYIVEPSIDKFRVCLCLYDLKDALRDKRFVFFVGRKSFAHLKQYFSDDQKELPEQVQTGDKADKIAEIVEYAASTRQTDFQNLCHENSTYYDAMSSQKWSETFRKGGIRILLSVSQNTHVLKHVMRDMCDGFKKLGHSVFILTEKDNLSLITPLSEVRTIQERKPDLIIEIDHLKSEYPWIPPNAPFVSYIQDDLHHLLDPGNAKKVNAFDVVIPGYHSILGNGLTCYGFPGESIHNINFLVTNTRVYRPPMLTQDDVKKYSASISFVSNHSQTPREKLVELKGLLCNPDSSARQKLSNLLDIFYNEIENYYASGHTLWAEYQCEEILRKSLKQAEIQLGATTKKFVMNYFFGQIGGKFLKHRILGWLKEENIPFTLYGAGWEKNPVFASYSRGVVQNGKDLCKVFAASKINLHIDINPFHFRVCDGFASGGFFLFNYTPFAVYTEKMPEIHRFLHGIHNKSSVNEICEKLEDKTASEILKGELYTSFHKTGEDIIEKEELQRLLDTRLPDEYLKFMEFLSFKNMESLYYKNKEEFIEKIKYFLTHDEERKKITEDSCRFIQDYSYTHFCKNIMDAVTNHFTHPAHPFPPPAKV